MRYTMRPSERQSDRIRRTSSAITSTPQARPRIRNDRIRLTYRATLLTQRPLPQDRHAARALSPVQTLEKKHAVTALSPRLRPTTSTALILSKTQPPARSHNSSVPAKTNAVSRAQTHLWRYRTQTKKNPQGYLPAPGDRHSSGQYSSPQGGQSGGQYGGQKINRALKASYARSTAANYASQRRQSSRNDDQASTESNATAAAIDGTCQSGRQLSTQHTASKAKKQQAQQEQKFKELHHIRSVTSSPQSPRTSIARYLSAPFRGLRKALGALHTATSAIVFLGGAVILVGFLFLSLTIASAASPMAILYANDAGSPYAPLSEVCASIDHDAQDKLEDIRRHNPHDVEELTGDFTPWPELLAVFATHTVTRRDGKATDVVAFDNAKIELLQQFYWEMNRIDYHIEIRGSGDSTIRVLVINIKSHTFDGMMDTLHFDDAQRQMAREVLAELQRTGSTNNSHIVYNPSPSAPIGDGSYAALLREAERHLGAPYKLGTNNAPYEFDCGYFVQYVFNRSGVAHINVRRATQLYEMCQPISSANAAPGDLVFFHGTYDTPTKCSHVGIYVGDHTMIHSGSPVKYSRIDTPYWQEHFYAFGRLTPS